MYYGVNWVYKEPLIVLWPLCGCLLWDLRTLLLTFTFQIFNVFTTTIWNDIGWDCDLNRIIQDNLNISFLTKNSNRDWTTVHRWIVRFYSVKTSQYDLSWWTLTCPWEQLSPREWSRTGWGFRISPLCVEVTLRHRNRWGSLTAQPNWVSLSDDCRIDC